MIKSVWRALNDTPYTNEIALSVGSYSITYSKLKESVKLFCDKLNAIGIRKGDVVTIALPNLIETVIAFYGVNANGCIANMVHPSLPNSALRSIQENTHSKLLVGLKTHKSINYKITCLVDPSEVTSWENFMLTPSTTALYNESDGVCAYLHSGGTTDKPKTIILSNKNLNGLANSLSKIFTKDECIGYKALTALPTFHAFGLGAGIHSLLLLGAHLVLVPKFDKIETPKLFVSEKINIMLGVPFMFRALVNSKTVLEQKNLSHVKYCFAGGDYVSEELLTTVNDIFASKNSTSKLLVGYGLTECVSVVSVNTHDNYKIGTVGKPLDKINISILDRGKFVAKNHVGEICVSSDTVMMRYLNGHSRSFIEKGGLTWLKTGDYGYIDDDGYLYFVDRKKRIIKINGVTVFPSEIELAVSNRYDTLCFAKLNKDKKLVLYVDKKNNISVTEQEIIDYCKLHLMKWAVPSRVVFIDNIPLTPLGKIDISNKIFE